MSNITKKAGRPKGSKSADSIAYHEFLLKNKFIIPKQELWALDQAEEMYEYYKAKLMTGQYSPMEDQSAKYLKIYQDMLKEMASRVYAKLKAVEVHVQQHDPKDDRPLEHLSNEELDKL